jgi:hypothetical protein
MKCRSRIQRSIYLGTIGNCKTETSRKPMPIDERVAADILAQKGNQRIHQPRRVGICQFPQPRQNSSLARYGAGKGDSACGAESWNSQEDWMAHISPHLLDTSDCKRKEREGCPGAHAPCQQSVYAGNLFPSLFDCQKRGSATSGRGYSSRTNRGTRAGDSK